LHRRLPRGLPLERPKAEEFAVGAERPAEEDEYEDKGKDEMRPGRRHRMEG
jgi:hypothetical protein